MISIVLPAHNEEKCLPRTLASVFAAARALGEEFEVIVADDGSTDGTAAAARAAGATVVSAGARQIAATRNAGARAARGDRLVFIDADTILPPATLAAARASLDGGAVGGGARVEIDGPAGRGMRLGVGIWNLVSRTLRWAAGSFVFVRRADFEAVGGFDERYYAGEELHLSRALKRRGRFVILDAPVYTSPRKEILYGHGAAGRTFLRVLLSGGRILRGREGLDLWYDGRR